jgi:hypothetical protein
MCSKNITTRNKNKKDHQNWYHFMIMAPETFSILIFLYNGHTSLQNVINYKLQNKILYPLEQWFSTGVPQAFAKWALNRRMII